MPFDLIGDFRRLPGTDPTWLRLTLAFAQKLVEQQPRVRFRLRNFSETRDTLTSRSIPLALEASEVPEALKSRVNLPEPTYFWVHKYWCGTCHLSVGHGQRLVHKRQGHELVVGDITHKGIQRSWESTHRVMIGSPERLYERGGDGFYAGITAAPLDSKRLKLDAVLLLRLRKNRDHQADLTAAGTDVGAAVLLDPGFDSAVASFLKWYEGMDRDALDPPVDQTEEEKEEAEYQRQLSAQRGAAAFVGGAMGKALPPKAQAVPAKAVAAVPPKAPKKPKKRRPKKET